MKMPRPFRSAHIEKIDNGYVVHYSIDEDIFSIEQFKTLGDAQDAIVKFLEKSSD